MKLNSLDDSSFEVELMTCVIDKSNDLTVVDCDSHFREFVGVHPSKIKEGKLRFINLLHHRDRESIFHKLCKKNAVYSYINFDIKNGDGEYVYVRCTSQNYPESPYLRLTIVDISQSVRKQEKLKAHAQEISDLINLVSGGICMFKVDDDMSIEALYVNESFCSILGTTKQNFMSRNYHLDETVYKDDKSKLFQAIGAAMATGKSVDTNFRIKKNKTEFKWVKFDTAIHHYDSDNCPIFHAVLSDITSLKNAEEKADRQYEMLAKIFKNLPGTFFCADDETPFNLEFASTDFYELLGYTKAEFIAKCDNDLRKLIPPNEFKRAYFEFKSKANENDGEVAILRYSIEKKNGEFADVIDTRQIIDLENGDNTTLGSLALVE